MTGQTDSGMKFTILVAPRIADSIYLMQAVTITTGRRILIPGYYRLAVYRLTVVLMIIMTICTLGDNFSFITLPVGMDMHIVMTVSTGDIVEHMHA